MAVPITCYWWGTTKETCLEICTDIGLLLWQMYTLSVPHDKTHIHLTLWQTLVFVRKSSSSFSVRSQKRLDGKRRTVYCPVYCLVLLYYLWSLSGHCRLCAVCILNDPGRVRSSWMCNCFWRHLCIIQFYLFDYIIIVIIIIIKIIGGPVCISLMCVI